jgi:lactate dehydrogenase-like 2-hydroxyacid dehydrogenase
LKHKLVSFLTRSEEELGALFEGRTEDLHIVCGGNRVNTPEEKACEVVKDADVIVAFPGSPLITRKMLEAAKRVKLVQASSVGYDFIDLDAATELGIPVANNPGWNSTSVAEHTIMLILMTLKRAIHAHTKGRVEGFSMPEIQSLWPQVWELRGKTLGLIGLGETGKEVAKLARAFEPEMIYYKRTRLSEEEERELGVEYRAFEELLKESDIITLHVPLTEETKGMIGREEIAKMKDGAIIINVAREYVLDDVAAADALKAGKLHAVGVDVVPVRISEGRWYGDTPLRDCDYVASTPHLAGATKEAWIRAARQWSENVKRLLDGEKPLYLVNDVWAPDNQ